MWKLLIVHNALLLLGISALVLRSDCALLQTDLVGESELGSVVQRIKVDPSSFFSLMLRVLPF